MTHNAPFFYFVKTPPTGLALTLAEAKMHLRVDDDTPGVKAAVSFGSSNSQIIVSARYDGSAQNAWSVIIIEAGNNTALSVSRVANQFVITLATNSGGISTSTVNDVIAEMYQDGLIVGSVTVSPGLGTGTGVLQPAAAANFSGGVDGTSHEDDLITSLIIAAQTDAENFLRKKLLTQTLVQKRQGFLSGRGGIELDYGPVQSITSLKYYDENDQLQTLTTPYTLFSLEKDRVPAILELGTNQNWPGTIADKSYPVEIEYVSGYGSVIPTPILVAMKLTIGSWYSNREEVIISPGATQVILSHGVQNLLWPYRDYRF